MKILVDLERQGSFLLVCQINKKAAPLALLMKMWGRSLVGAFSWTPVGGWCSVGPGSCGSVPHECSYDAPVVSVSPGAIWLSSQGTGPQPTLTQRSGPPALGGALTLACEFPSWVLASHSHGNSLTTTLLLSHPIWVYFSALWDTVASTAEGAADSISYLNALTSLGEA